jgi:regulator of sigma E protease
VFSIGFDPGCSAGGSPGHAEIQHDPTPRWIRKVFGDVTRLGLPVPGLAQLPSGRDVSFFITKARPTSCDSGWGPAANVLFAIVVLAILFMTYGQPFTPAEVGQVQPGSAAEQGGIQPGDVIVNIDGNTVQRFEDVQQVVRLNPGVAMTVVVRRDGQEQTLHVTPSRTELTDGFGNHYQIGLLGIACAGWNTSSGIRPPR